MGFAEDVAKLSEHVSKRADQVAGEESTKMALIVPFLNALGYDIYDPTEVRPEFTADFAIKRSGQLEKVDYAIAIDGTIIMVVEAKARGQKVEAHDGQLMKYFNCLVDTKVAIVTNGVEYRFFTDLREKNIMDKEPFFSFNVLSYDSKDIEHLKFFHRDNFDPSAIKDHAEELVYVKQMTKIIGEILRAPSEPFMRFLIGQMNVEGRINSNVLKKFEPIIKKSLQSSLVELMTRSLSQEISSSIEPVQQPEVEAIDEDELPVEESKVETTEEELEAFEKIKRIAQTSNSHSLEVQYKDVVSYFGLNVGKPSWWFLRLYLSSKKKNLVTRLPIDEVKPLAVGFEVQEMSASLGDAASRVMISSGSDLGKLEALILKCYETEAAKH